MTTQGKVTDHIDHPGIIAYDLASPFRLLAPPSDPRCPVCGQELPATLRAELWGRTPDRHAGCRRTIAGWDRRVQAINVDADLLAAEEAVEEARAAADALWEAKVRAIPNLPGWYIRQRVASHCDPERY